MAEKKKVITNQAEIDAANRANVAAAQRKSQLEAAAAAAFEKGKPIITQALSGVSGLNKALQAQIKAAENSKGIYDPIAGTFRSGAQLQKEANTLAKSATGANRLGGLTPEQIELSKQYGREKTEAETAAAGIQFVDVPGAIYSEEEYSEEETDTAGKTSAYDLLNEFKLLGLDSLLEDIKRLIIDGVGDDQLLLEIRKTPAWQKRFAANKTRLAKGLRALSEGEYIDLETKYQEIMRNYGLPASYYSKTATGTNESFEKLIGGNVSPVKLEEKIMIGTNRVLNASPFITTALKEFFPEITNGDILAYVLDPDRGLDEINRKVTAAEIGGAFLGTKTTAGETLTTSLSRAEELARAGVTGATAKQAATAIGGGLERGRQLTSFYQQSPYTQELAEQELLNLPGQTEAREKRRKVIELDKSEFNKKTGYTSGAISLDRAGSY
jgi:hypothetical protein